MDKRILDIQGWMSEGELRWIIDSVKSLPNNAIIVELGAWRGRSTCAFISALKPSQTFVTIDTWLGQPNLRLSSHNEALCEDLFFDFVANIKQFGITPKWFKREYKSGCYYLRMESNLAPICFENVSVDMIFDDCDHTKFGETIDAWYRKIKKGGLISGHDYGWEGAKTAIDDRIYVSGTMESIWYGYKDAVDITGQAINRDWHTKG